MTVELNEQGLEDYDLQKAPVELRLPPQSTASIGFWASVAFLTAAGVAARMLHDAPLPPWPACPPALATGPPGAARIAPDYLRRPAC